MMVKTSIGKKLDDAYYNLREVRSILKVKESQQIALKQHKNNGNRQLNHTDDKIYDIKVSENLSSRFKNNEIKSLNKIRKMFIGGIVETYNELEENTKQIKNLLQIIVQIKQEIRELYVEKHKKVDFINSFSESALSNALNNVRKSFVAMAKAFGKPYKKSQKVTNKNINEVVDKVV